MAVGGGWRRLFAVGPAGSAAAGAEGAAGQAREGDGCAGTDLAGCGRPVMSRQANGCTGPVPAGATVRTPTDMGQEGSDLEGHWGRCVRMEKATWGAIGHRWLPTARIGSPGDHTHEER